MGSHHVLSKVTFTPEALCHEVGSLEVVFLLNEILDGILRSKQALITILLHRLVTSTSSI